MTNVIENIQRMINYSGKATLQSFGLKHFNVSARLSRLFYRSDARFPFNICIAIHQSHMCLSGNCHNIKSITHRAHCENNRHARHFEMEWNEREKGKIKSVQTIS